jgi:hypothetical protein
MDALESTLLTSNHSNGGHSVKKSSVPPTLNFSWAMATAICFWFLFIHTPFYLMAKDNSFEPLTYVHLFGAYSIYLTCVHNTLLTPSALNGAARPLHIWIGRAGLILGVFGFISGFTLVWFIYGPEGVGWGFAIGITYGGFAQMQLQFAGYRAIQQYKRVKTQIESLQYTSQGELYSLQDEQDKHLSSHILCMINLFVLACGIPALIRVVEVIGFVWLPLLIAVLYFLSYSIAKPIMRKLYTKRAERNECSSVESELVPYTFANFFLGSTKASTLRA